MKLEDIFNETVRRLRKENADFAVCGGIAAITYRPDIRLTADVDFIISCPPRTIDIATSVIESFGLKAHTATLANISPAPSMNKKSSPIAFIVGRNPDDKAAPGVDFLTTSLPWVEKALERSRDNLLTFGLEPTPFITAEDVIIAKLYAMQNPSRHGKDLDDVQSIISSGRTLDFSYIAAEVTRHKIFLRKPIEQVLPKALSVVLKRLRAKY